MRYNQAVNDRLFLVVNIFFLSDDPREAAEMHCDAHVRKMLIESAQMLSAAHRLHDGTPRSVEVSVPIDADPAKVDEPDPFIISTSNTNTVVPIINTASTVYYNSMLSSPSITNPSLQSQTSMTGSMTNVAPVSSMFYSTSSIDWVNSVKISKYHRREIFLLDGEHADIKAVREAQVGQNDRWFRGVELHEKVPLRLLKPENFEFDGKLKVNKWRWAFDLEIKGKKCCLVSHMKHPCTEWVLESVDHYAWLYELMKHLHEEFKYRFSKEHQCWLNWHKFLAEPPKKLTDIGFRSPPLAMPENYQIAHNPIESYRNYYVHEKRFATWTSRLPPKWWLVAGALTEEELCSQP